MSIEKGTRGRRPAMAAVWAMKEAGRDRTGQGRSCLETEEGSNNVHDYEQRGQALQYSRELNRSTEQKGGGKDNHNYDVRLDFAVEEEIKEFATCRQGREKLSFGRGDHNSQ
jgi:hypothetical protein